MTEDINCALCGEDIMKHMDEDSLYRCTRGQGVFTDEQIELAIFRELVRNVHDNSVDKG